MEISIPPLSRRMFLAGSVLPFFCGMRAPRTVYSAGTWHGGPLRVFDATGTELDHVIECEVETGRILRYVTDHDGYLQRDGDDVRRETVYVAAPLLVRRKQIGDRPPPPKRVRLRRRWVV